jgi:heptosyltransferase III
MSANGGPGGATWGERPRILVIRRDNIGDLVCTTPALTLLRGRYPRAYIAALVNSYNAPVLRGNPCLDEVFSYVKGKHVVPGGTRLAAWLGKWLLMRAIRARRFDVAIVAATLPTAGWIRLARATGARHVLAAVPPDGPVPRGVSLPVRRAGGFEKRHMVEQIASLLAPLGISEAPPALSIYPDATATARIVEALRGIGPTRSKIRIGVHISARKPRQRWPADRFPMLMQSLYAATGCGFALFWAPGPEGDTRHPGDDDRAAAVMGGCANLPVLPIATHTLDELIAGLSAVDALICSDGGAMHLAAALGKPIVCFFGNSEPRTWRPWGVPHRVLQSAAEDVTEVTVEEARDAALDLLSAAGPAGS